ncbi:MAG: 4-hydroxythreonine-4-phosphate dehydrogenase PdxA [Spiribacter sp.]|jgi:4-hydroxythreonine-4-phosphate dehydrogenase|nr:4-hydroxythreonine-4-phosphate dehydrogenase PdxA [Spiribacter sp.]MDR9489536.1 4-hydroxythreonine-4-phosphate dehydrogenase PdxA [Spiribacter sp.]
MTTRPCIAITPGEPAGIGPELMAEIIDQFPMARLVIIADPALMKSLGVVTQPYTTGATPQPGVTEIIPVSLNASVQSGMLNPANAEYVLETLRIAARGCLAGEFNAMVTGPVHKGVINEAGHVFSGHTEFLAELTNAARPVMMLVADSLRVALVTTHLPLRAVADAITAERLEQVIRILHGDLIQRFGLSNPNILVAGLNPHAGESGHMGVEEIQIIEPVLNRLRKAGMQLDGPLPADTLFTPGPLASADAVLAMYHDQGLPVLKHAGFGHAVNITLGLPIIRTSVDHGTALDLAGSGRASTASLHAAIAQAIELCAT